MIKDCEFGVPKQTIDVFLHHLQTKTNNAQMSVRWKCIYPKRHLMAIALHKLLPRSFQGSTNDLVTPPYAHVFMFSVVRLIIFISYFSDLNELLLSCVGDNCFFWSNRSIRIGFIGCYNQVRRTIYRHSVHLQGEISCSTRKQFECFLNARNHEVFEK